MPNTPNKPTAWRMPIARNLHFAGREKILLDLRVRLGHADPMSRVQAICGPGGIGKTQLGVEYAYRFRGSYQIVWYIAASSRGLIELGLAALARTLGLSDREDVATHELRDILFDHLAGREDWLLIFDDVPDQLTVNQLLPPRSGNVLITSRSANWLQIGRSFALGALARHESVELLLARCSRKEDPEMADKLAQALGDVPVALDQAAALIEQARISFADYLARFETHWAELLKMGQPSADYPLTVAMSWELSFKQLEEMYPRAADVLAVCAFLAPELPRRLLRQIAPFAPPDVAPVLHDPVAAGEALAQLTDYSLIEFDERTIRLQPLAAGLARDRLSEDEQRTWSSTAARAMEALFRFDANHLDSWRESGELLDHALAAARHADHLGSAPAAVRSIFNQAGHFLLAMAQLDEARKLLERAMEIAAGLWGETSPRLSPIANNLGRVLLRLGEAAAVRTQFERALALDEAYGATHTHVAEVINNRGVCLHALGELSAAEQDFRRALAIYEMTDSRSQAKVAAIVNNLGFSLISRGDHAGAREQFAAALSIAQQSLGTSHPLVASVLRNLGKACLSLGQFTDAQVCFEKALEIDEKLLGPNHPDTAADLAGLGDALDELLLMPRARSCHQRAAAIEEAQPVRNVERLIHSYKVLTRLARNLDETEDARRYSAKAAELKGERAPHPPQSDEGLATFAITP